MSDWTTPSDAELAQVVTLATRFENRAYFFDRLENPEWVPALAERGVFDNPPSPVPADEPGYVRFPPWPEGRYLVRMAPVAPDAVAAVLERVPPSANPYITRILLDAVQALPGEQFRRLAPKTVEWITAAEATQFIDYFAEEAATAIARLVRADEFERGLRAARALLWLEPRSGASNGSPSDESFTLTPEPVGRLSDWEYEQVTAKMLPDLVESAGIEGLRLFSSLLSVAVKFSRREDEPPDSDGHSYIWETRDRRPPSEFR